MFTLMFLGGARGGGGKGGGHDSTIQSDWIGTKTPKSMTMSNSDSILQISGS